jgi:hypothetical protein
MIFKGVVKPTKIIASNRKTFVVSGGDIFSKKGETVNDMISKSRAMEKAIVSIRSRFLK